MTCAQPPATTDDYCGVGLAPTIDRAQLISHWRFLPFPAAGAKEVGTPIFPKQYECVGNGAQLWTFHFDTLDYTSGCDVVDLSTLAHQPCNVLLYTGTDSVEPLYAEHGKVAACGTLGSTVVGVMDGNPQPGAVVCNPPAPNNPEATFSFCGLGPVQSPLRSGNWHFTALPVASGPVDSATFDTAAGTACITVGAQSFTFTVATSAVTSGCAGAPPATATP